LLLLMLGCAHAPTRDPDLEAVARQGLSIVEGKHSLQVLAGPELTTRARQAIEVSRRVRTPSADEGIYLSASEVRVDEVTVTGSTARFRATQGPVPHARPGDVNLDCGQMLDLEFEKRAGVWELVRMGFGTC
jgi:hypothetical protein